MLVCFSCFKSSCIQRRKLESIAAIASLKTGSRPDPTSTRQSESTDLLITQAVVFVHSKEYVRKSSNSSAFLLVR